MTNRLYTIPNPVDGRALVQARIDKRVARRQIGERLRAPVDDTVFWLVAYPVVQAGRGIR